MEPLLSAGTNAISIAMSISPSLVATAGPLANGTMPPNYLAMVCAHCAIDPSKKEETSRSMGELKAFTITRSEWLRGEGPDCSYLHRASDDKECCLGQFLRRVHGVPAAQLLGSRTPRDMLHRLPKTAKKDVF